MKSEMPSVDCMQLSFYRLNAEEMRFCLDYAHKVYEIRKAIKSHNYLGWDTNEALQTTAAQAYEIGSIGYFAYLKIMGRDWMIPDKFRVDPKCGQSEDGSDDLLYGKRIRIRATGSMNYLALWPRELNEFDFAVAMYVRNNAAYCKGFISTDQFKKIHKRNPQYAEYGKKPWRKIIPHSALNYIFLLEDAAR